MKTASDELFLLVKSLSTQEKVFFKRYYGSNSTSSGENSYRKLFDALERLTEFDEQKLKSALKKIGFEHNLDKAKSYLIEALLHSLSNYHSETMINAKLQNLLCKAELVFEKGIPKMAHKFLDKAEKLALQHECIEYLFIVRSIKADIIFYSSKGINEFLTTDVRSEEHYLALLQNKIAYRNLALKAAQLTNEYGHNARKGEVEKIISSPLLKNKKNALTFYSVSKYYFIRYVYHHSLGKWDEKSYRLQREWIELLEKDPLSLHHQPKIYIQALSHLVSTLVHISRGDEANRTFEKAFLFYNSLPSKSKTKLLDGYFMAMVGNYLAAQLIMLKPENAIYWWSKISERVVFSSLKPALAIAFYHNLYYAHFLLGKHHDAIKWLNQLLTVDSRNRMDALATARTSALMSHYEIGNFELLPTIARSAHQWFKRNKYSDKWEKIVFAFFQKNDFATTTKKERLALLKELQKELSGLKPGGVMDEFLNWLHAKLENKSLYDIMKRQAEMNKKSS